MKNDLDYIDNPRLKDPSEIYYTGVGADWDIDLDGNRYYKRYHSQITESFYLQFGKVSPYNLSNGEIVNEKGRIRKIIKEYLSEIGLNKNN